VKALVGEGAGDAHRSRKGDNTWNNLVIVSFDTMITCLNVGWEGSAHDLTVLRDNLLQPKYNSLIHSQVHGIVNVIVNLLKL